MVNANSLSVGNVVVFNGKYCLIVKKEHVKPGKGGALLQLEMKDIKTGNKIPGRVNTTEDIEVATMEEKTYQYQYMEGENLALMDMESYEQLTLPKSLLNETALLFLQEGMDVKVEYCDDEAIRIRIPEKITMKVVTAEVAIKGQTATASYKPAVLENGVRVMVPPFVVDDDTIVVNTEDGSSVERVT
jgi:elongation factor P